MSALHVELLTKAREIVADPASEGGICRALEDAADTRELTPTSLEIKHHIELLLLQTGFLDIVCLETWLTKKHGVAPKSMRRGMPKYALDSWSFGITKYPPTKKLIATRLAWIDWLIEEWRDAP